MRKALTLTAAAAVLVASAVAAAPASAESTTLSATVDTGGLAIDVTTAATSVTLAASGGATSILPGGSLSGSLGTTSVDDTRGSSTGWTASIAASDFVSGANTIAIDNASVTVAALGGLSLPTTCGVGGTLTFPVAAQKLTTAATQLAKCAGLTSTTIIGASAADWTSTVSLTVPSTAVSGTYTSTVIQSVQ